MSKYCFTISVGLEKLYYSSLTELVVLAIVLH